MSKSTRRDEEYHFVTDARYFPAGAEVPTKGENSLVFDFPIIVLFFLCGEIRPMRAEVDAKAQANLEAGILALFIRNWLRICEDPENGEVFFQVLYKNPYEEEKD